MNNFKKSETKTKPGIQFKKDEMTSFIESEFNKFKKIKPEIPVAAIAPVNNKTKSGDVISGSTENFISNKGNMGVKNNNMIPNSIASSMDFSGTTTYSKFPGFKMPDKCHNSSSSVEKIKDILFIMVLNIYKSEQ